MHKDNLHVLTLPVLLATLLTNSMEITPYKKLEKTDNIIRNFSFNDKDTTIPERINPRPTIKANLYINNKESKASYCGINNYKSLNKAGITSSIKNQQKMPLVSVIVKDADNIDWTHNIPMAIQRYELKKNLTEEEQEKQFYKICKKKFPHSIPADLLYERKTGDSIHLTVHGYPVIATCLDNAKTHLPFKEHFTLHMDNFKKKPSYFINFSAYDDDVQKELEEAGIISVVGHYGPNNCCDKLAHGPNGFASIDKLLLEDKNIPTNMFHYLKQRETGHKTFKMPSEEKLPFITRDAFVPQQIDIDDYDDRPLGCVIS